MRHKMKSARRRLFLSCLSCRMAALALLAAIWCQGTMGFDADVYTQNVKELEGDFQGIVKALDAFDRLSLEQQVAAIDAFVRFEQQEINEDNKDRIIKEYQRVVKLCTAMYYEHPLSLPAICCLMKMHTVNPAPQLTTFFPYFAALRSGDRSQQGRFQKDFLDLYHRKLLAMFERYVLYKECKLRRLEGYMQYSPASISGYVTKEDRFRPRDASMIKTLARDYADHEAAHSAFWKAALPLLEYRELPPYKPTGAHSRAIPTAPEPHIAQRIRLMEVEEALFRYAEAIQQRRMAEMEGYIRNAEGGYAIGFKPLRAEKEPTKTIPTALYEELVAYREAANRLRIGEMRKRRHCEAAALFHRDQWKPQQALVDFYLQPDIYVKMGPFRKHPLLHALHCEHFRELPDSQLKLASMYFAFRAMTRRIVMKPPASVRRQRKEVSRLLRQVKANQSKTLSADSTYWCIRAMCEAFLGSFEKAETALEKAKAVSPEGPLLATARKYVKNMREFQERKTAPR